MTFDSPPRYERRLLTTLAALVIQTAVLMLATYDATARGIWWVLLAALPFYLVTLVLCYLTARNLLRVAWYEGAAAGLGALDEAQERIAKTLREAGRERRN